MAVKITAALSGVILALAAVISIMACILKSKSKKIKSLEASARRQKEIIAETDTEKKAAEAKKKQLSRGTDIDKFNASMDILKKAKEKNKGDSK